MAVTPRSSYIAVTTRTSSFCSGMVFLHVWFIPWPAPAPASPLLPLNSSNTPSSAPAPTVLPPPQLPIFGVLQRVEQLGQLRFPCHAPGSMINAADWLISGRKQKRCLLLPGAWGLPALGLIWRGCRAGHRGLLKLCSALGPAPGWNHLTQLYVSTALALLTDHCTWGPLWAL